jgi:hypothetical protein
VSKISEGQCFRWNNQWWVVKGPDDEEAIFWLCENESGKARWFASNDLHVYIYGRKPKTKLVVSVTSIMHPDKVIAVERWDANRLVFEKRTYPLKPRYLMLLAQAKGELE